MSYTVTSQAQTSWTDSQGYDTQNFTLAPLNFGSKVVPVYPIKIANRISVGASETIDFTSIYRRTGQVLRLLVVSSTRPIGMVLNGLVNAAPVVYSLPTSTYYHYLYSTKETSGAINPQSLVLTAPAAPTTAPNPTPEQYPDVLVTVLVAVDNP
jgi:hypothetical protein